MNEGPTRILPELRPENEEFWTAGSAGELRILRCASCRHYIHPPAPVCPQCLGRQLATEPVCGRAQVLTFTINHQPWIPGFEPPYVIAIVELVEQTGLRLTTNITGCDPDDVSIGMKVRVRFEDAGEGVFLPLFAPEQT